MTRYHALTVCAGEVPLCVGEADGGVDNSKIEKLLGFGPHYFGIPPEKSPFTHLLEARDLGYDGRAGRPTATRAARMELEASASRESRRMLERGS